MNSKWEPVSIHFSASKSGSEKSKNRTSSTSASFPIRYRSLEEYDDEEYSLLTFEKPDRGDDKNRRSSTFSESTTTTPPNPSGSPSTTPAAASSSSSSSSSLFSSSLSFLSSPSPLSSHPLSEPTTTTTATQQQQQPPSSSSSPSPSPSTLSPPTAVVASSPYTTTTTTTTSHSHASSSLSSSSSSSATTPTSPSTITTTTEAQLSSSSSSWSSQTPPAATSPPKAVISPSKTSAGENDKKTLLANIRGKLHRKWEELSGDSSNSSSSNLLSNSSSSTDHRENSENRDNERKFPSSSPVRKQNSDEGVGSGSGPGSGSGLGSGSGSGVFSESSPHPSPYKVPTSSTFPGTNTAAPCSSSSSSSFFSAASSSKSPAAMDSSVDGALSEQVEQGEELTEDLLTTTTANTTTTTASSTSLAAEDNFAFPSENLLVYRTSDGTNTVHLSSVAPTLPVPPVRSTRMSLRERLRGSSSSSSSKNSSSSGSISSRQRNQKAPKLPPLEPAPMKMSYLQRQNSAPNSATFTVEDDFEEFVDNDGRIYYDVEDDDDSDDTNDRDRGAATTAMKTKKEKRNQSRQKKAFSSSSSSSLLLLGSDRDDKAGTASVGGGGVAERLADGSTSLSSSSSSAAAAGGGGAGGAVSNLDQKRQAHQLRKRGHNSANSDHATDNENSSPSSSTSIPSSFSSASSGTAAAKGPAREGRTLRLPPTQRLVVVSVFIFLYLIIPMPPYLSGAIFGCVVTSLAWLAYFRLKKACYSGAPSRRANMSQPIDGNNLATAAASLSISQLPPLLVPEMKEPKLEDTIIYKGWMNELFYYDSDNYHINKTNSVYVRLEGVTLRLSTPKTNVPKRAMFDENLSNPTFISQRHYNLNNCRVFLLPAGLVKKRLWSKKYPICVDLSTNSAQKSAGGNSGGSSGQKKSSSKDSSVCPSPSTELGFEIISEEACNPTILYLFARTGREKEEWFKRFQAASLGAPLGNHILDIRNALKAAAATTAASTAAATATETGSSISSSNHKRSDSDTNIVGADGFHRHRRHNSSDSVNSSSSGTTTPVDSTFDHLSPDSAGHHHHHPNHHHHHQQQQQQQHTNIKKFSQYMAQLMPATFDDAKSNSNSSGGSSGGSSVRSRRESQSVSASSTPSSPTGREVHSPDLPSTILDFSEPQLLWINALIGRCLWDFLQDKSWTEKVIEKLQKKLSKIHVPYFIEELKITDIDLGTSIPILQKSSKPYLDERGFWVNFQTMYTGGFKMTISTKVNLMKLKKNSLEKSPVATSRRSAVTDSNEEDSAESSTDEEPDDNGLDDSSSSGGAVPPSGAGGSGTSRKILRYIDMITQSKYFQQATEYKYIKKAMEGVSNTPLVLTVEVHSLNGVLTINVPPPPTDRLWYGFRDNPQLTLVAKPKVGEREVTVTHVTEWIEKKLTIEFQRLLVLPNMDDLPVPIMTNPLKEFDEDSTTTTTTTTNTTNNNNSMSRPLKTETMATEH
ncbi:testis-expressed protein 2-like isoform X1 [Argonauta hians]